MNSEETSNLVVEYLTEHFYVIYLFIYLSAMYFFETKNAFYLDSAISPVFKKIS